MNRKEQWIFLGASRGIGRATLDLAMTRFPSAKIFAAARKIETLPATVHSQSFDFSKENLWKQILDWVCEQRPTRMFYFAGGGPYGPYVDHHWKSHDWAYRVTLLFPAYLLAHSKLIGAEQWIFLGSAICEDQPHPLGAAYASAKHGLRGLITSLQAEPTPPRIELFSPGYVDTDLIPANVELRRQGTLIADPSHVAEQILALVQAPAM